MLSGRVIPIIFLASLSCLLHPATTPSEVYTLAKYFHAVETYDFNSCGHPDHKHMLCVRNGSWTVFFSYSVASPSSFSSTSDLSSWNSSLFMISAVQLGEVRLVLLPSPPSASAAVVAT